jgi:hypothetical protein
MAGTTKRIKPGSPGAVGSAPRDRVTVRRVARSQMRQALQVLGLFTDGEALPSGRFALIELPLKAGGSGFRRIVETSATEQLPGREELRGAAQGPDHRPRD